MRGFDNAVIARLRPHVTALPRYTQVNVNTASAEVVAALVEGMDLDAARVLVAQRHKIYFQNAFDFSSRVPSGLRVHTEDITVSSDFFIATLRVTIGETQARGTALLQRENTGWPAIVWRKYL